MKHAPSLDFTHTWNAEQVLAAYNFCYQMCEALWDEHEDILHEHIRQSMNDHGHPLSDDEDHRTLELPFDDDIPF